MFCYQRSQAQRVQMEIDDQVCPNKKCEISEGLFVFNDIFLFLSAMPLELQFEREFCLPNLMSR